MDFSVYFDQSIFSQPGVFLDSNPLWGFSIAVRLFVYKLLRALLQLHQQEVVLVRNDMSDFHLLVSPDIT